MQRLPKREVFQIQVRRKAFLHRTSREREEGQKKSLRHQLVAIFFSVLLWAAARARRLFCIVFNRDAHNNTHALFFMLYYTLLFKTVADFSTVRYRQWSVMGCLDSYRTARRRTTGNSSNRREEAGNNRREEAANRYRACRNIIITINTPARLDRKRIL